uniref:Pseudouridine synthase I TruA alpha/beta domain-containing protein n=1 Tax=Guillardia theta TaxID=55529 RepID=A0A7S4H854_GUITH
MVKMNSTESAAEKRKADEEEEREEPSKKPRQEEDGEEDDNAEQEGNGKKFQKRMVCVQMAYLGTNYSGLQKNPGQSTIEGELERALHDSKFISDLNFGHQKKVHWNRAARTDKGVHALGNVVGLKLLINPDVDMVEEVNKHLPSDIRVLDIKRVTKSFHAQQLANGRQYHYLIPTFVFESCEAPETSELIPEGKTENNKNFWEGCSSYTPTEEEIAKAKDFRVTDDVVERVSKLLSQYVGTHSFHNFTSGKKKGDADAKRYIVSFKVGERVIFDGYEYLELRVEGQSFLLHQIRKMIGLVVFTIRYKCDNKEKLSIVWSDKKVHIPLVPGVGLFLNKVLYRTYNKTNKHLQPLDFEDVKDKIEDFKTKMVHIVAMFPHSSLTQ